MTMSAAMLLGEGPVTDDVRRAGGKRCYNIKGVDNNSKQREQAADNGAVG